MSLQIIHTADWHLGQTFFGYDRDEEHEAFLTWLTGMLAERQADVLLSLMLPILRLPRNVVFSAS